MVNNDKIKIYYQFATAKKKAVNGKAEILKRKKFLERNIGSNSEITLAIPSQIQLLRLKKKVLMLL
jgi:hypothetical protein